MIEINTRIVLRSARYPDGLSSRVEHADPARPDRLSVATPSLDGTDVTLGSGDEFDLEWTTPDDDARSVQVRVLGDAKLRVPAVVVELIGASQEVQRRYNVRLPVSLRLLVWEISDDDDDDSPPMIGSVYDLSGGGMQARIPRRLHIGERFWVRFELPERGFIETEAVVRRHIAGDVYGLAFEDISAADSERIIRAIFSIMRAQLARRSGSG
jgi:c-di-GMP-binding flagellar brake protein YcgR